MWQGDFTFEALMESRLVAVDMSGCMPEAEATIRGPLELDRMKGWQTILGECCAQRMLNLAYAAPGVNSW